MAREMTLTEVLLEAKEGERFVIMTTAGSWVARFQGGVLCWTDGTEVCALRCYAIGWTRVEEKTEQEFEEWPLHVSDELIWYVDSKGGFRRPAAVRATKGFIGFRFDKGCSPGQTSMDMFRLWANEAETDWRWEYDAAKGFTVEVLADVAVLLKGDGDV